MNIEDYARIGSAYDTDPLEPLSTVPRPPRPRFVSSFGTLMLGIAIGALIVTAVVGAWRVWP